MRHILKTGPVIVEQIQPIRCLILGINLLLLPLTTEANSLEKRQYKDGDTIAIIGAGVSGIATVKGLIENGVPPEEITVIEKESLAGGKVMTTTFEGRPYEVGAAVIIKNRYAAIEALAAHHGLTMRPLQPTKFLNVDTGKLTPDPAPNDPILIEIGKQVKFYMEKYTRDWSQITTWNGFANIPAELDLSWKEFLATYREKYGVGIELLNFRLSSALGGSGYVMMQDPPFAAQILRFISPKLLQSVLAPGAVNVFNAVEHDQCVEGLSGNAPIGGFQCLWIREAKELAGKGVKFEFETSVAKIERGDKVKLDLKQGKSVRTETYDHTFFTVDLRYLTKSGAALLSDATAEEQKLIGSIAVYPYRSYLVKLKNFPAVGAEQGYSAIFGLLPYMKNGDAKKGVLLVRPYKDSDVFQMYAFGGQEVDHAEILSGFKADMAKFGIEFDPARDVVASAQWEYFPHVSPASGLSLGDFFNRMMARQGVGGLWYAGEVFGFSLTIDVYEQAKAIAENFVKNKL